MRGRSGDSQRTAAALAGIASSFFDAYDTLCRGLQPRHVAEEAAAEAAATAAEMDAAEVRRATELITAAPGAAAGSLARAEPEAVAEAPAIMANFEVQAVNALAFALLRLANRDLPLLGDATEELAERHSLFTL